MSSFKVVFLKHGYPGVHHERQIVTAAGGEFIDTDPLSEPEAMRACEDADGLLVRWSIVNAALIERLRRCQIIVRYGVGYDNVDVGAATRSNIIVGHVPSYCLDEVSTHAISLLLACVRNVVGKHQKMIRGAWDTNPLEPLYRTAGRTLGLVGLGNIGQAVARKMAGWGMRLLASDPFVEEARAKELGVELAPLETVLRESDYISLHVPLLPETRHLISRRECALMKSGAILINTARGPVLDEAAMLAALESGRLAYAGLDVFEHEPPPANSPLRQHPRIVLSDHVAWYSEESQTELRITATQEAVRVCTGGLPVAIANPEVLHNLGRLAEWVPSENARWQFKRLSALGTREELDRFCFSRDRV
jgi:D-3-phosphoglycerate dehydrogenase / 2-oxoglutarate reductase